MALAKKHRADLAIGLLLAACGHAEAMPEQGVVVLGLPLQLEIVVVLVSISFAVAIGLSALSLVGRARRRFRSRLRFMRTALNYIDHGISMVDGRGRLVFCNDAFLDIHRLQRSDVRPNMKFQDLLDLPASRGTFGPALVDLNDALASQSVCDLEDGRALLSSRRPLPGGGWVATETDFTERRSLTREIEETKKFLEFVLDHIPVGVVVRQIRDHRYLLINRTGEKYLGVNRDDALRRPFDALYPAEEVAMIVHRDGPAIRNPGKVVINEYAVKTEKGMSLYLTRRVAVPDKDGTPGQIVLTVEDVTSQRQVQARMAHMAYHDGLTDLPNRVAFVQALEQMIEACAEGGEFAVLSMDLDRFKEINDVFGHAVGDRLLVEASKRIQQSAGGAAVARLGGDEFGLIIDGVQPKSASELAGRLIEAMRAEFVIDGKTIRFGVTVGVSIFPRDAADSASLLANADVALFRAKQEARGSVRVFEPAMDLHIRDRRAMHLDLSEALKNGELHLNYQPLAKADGRVIGFEALVRWKHRVRGMVSPGTFIPLAEESGLIVEIGEWILREACREAASWPEPLQIAVNLSPVQFLQGDLVALVHAILLETGLTPGRLEIEITEGVLIRDSERGLTLLRRLKALGVRIAMDDFGSGYSSLSYLQSFPFDKIKIDRAFIMNLGISPQSAAIVRAVIGLGHGLDIPILAEGVETEQQLAFLAEEGCDEVQGYYLGRPGPIAQYAELIGGAAPVQPSTAKPAARKVS